MFTQWSENEGHFVPVGNTVAEIQPGYYDVFQAQGQIYFAPVRPRTDDLLEFPSSASQAVLKGIRDFWDREDKFRTYGLPFKRGVLLYGPPGSGKTSTLQIVAREVVDRKGIVVTFPGSTDVFLSAYRALRDIQPKTPLVVLLEDFEVILRHVNESRLLNLLDGVEEMDRVLFVATTNYPEKLDARIVNRPSRFDIRIPVPPPNATARKMYLESLLQSGDDDINLAQYVTDTDGMSLAHLKELFVSTVILGVPYATAIRRLKEMENTRVSSTDAFDPEIDDAWGDDSPDWEKALVAEARAAKRANIGQYL